jgi:hypothetical protein
MCTPCFVQFRQGNLMLRKIEGFTHPDFKPIYARYTNGRLEIFESESATDTQDCVAIAKLSDWAGKGYTQTYQHGFGFTSSNGSEYQVCALSKEDKEAWVALIGNTGTVTEEKSGTSLSGSGLLESLVGATEQNSRATCEECEEDPATHRCVECQQVFCGDCTKVHQKKKKTKSHTVNPLPNSAPPPAAPLPSLTKNVKPLFALTKEHIDKFSTKTQYFSYGDEQAFINGLPLTREDIRRSVAQECCENDDGLYKEEYFYVTLEPARESEQTDPASGEIRIKDQGHDGMMIQDFANLDEAQSAGLKIVHIVVIRLYTGKLYKPWNDALRGMAVPNKDPLKKEQLRQWAPCIA